MRPIILLSLLGLAVPGCGPVARPTSGTTAAPDRALDDLLGLMRQRLVVMHDVARYKWAARSPIEDPVREKALLGNVEERGRALGLEPVMTRAFFAAQIEAAKLVQRADFRRWEADDRGPQGKAPDLAGVLRPRIDALNSALLAALARTQAPLRDGRPHSVAIRDRADERLTGVGIDAEVRTTAIRPLLGTLP